MALLGPWNTVLAQSRPLEPVDQLEFVLSRAADPFRDERLFSQADTLLMRVRDPAPKDSLSGVAAEEPIGWWLLLGETQSFSGALILSGDWLVGSLPLASARERIGSWTWMVDVERGGRTVASHRALLGITNLGPSADFVTSAQEGALPLAVSFEDRSLGGVTSWAWDFGDGASSSEPNPTHVYTTSGPHSVRLRVSNPWGEDTLVVADWIRPTPSDFAIQYGMNASENVWWQRGIVFADAMARAGEFFLVENGTIGRVESPLIPIREDAPLPGAGWPDISALAAGQKAGTRLFGSMGGTIPDGRELPYVLTWAGTGACRLEGTPVLGEANRTTNRVEVFVDPSASNGNGLLSWVIDWSDPADPVRDAHVWLPGMEAGQPILWPPFVEKVRTMAGGLGPSSWRGMNWCKVNEYGKTGGSAPFVFDLAGRILPSSPSQGTKRGVCPEFQVAFANAVGCDLHINVPHNANDLPDADYEFFLRDTFLRIRDGSPEVPGVNGGRPFEPLAPHLKLTVEFSNETWNFGFPVRAWLKARALARGVTLEQELAAQIRRVFRVAEEVFSGPHAARLRRFVGGWIVDPTFLRDVLAALGPGVHVDAAGPAFYFKPRTADIDAWLVDADGTRCPNCPSPEGVIESARTRLAELEPKLLEHRVIVEAYVNPDGSHPRFELYEGGASFDAGFLPWGLAASQAQRLPEMYDLYVRDYVPALIRQGVAVVTWYSFMTDNTQGAAGPFGHWNRMDQTLTLPVPDVYVDEGAPKAAAICRPPPRRTP
jgi:PKD repeat protein